MMGEEFYAIIKLVSGEEVLSLVSVDDNDGDPVLILQQPVIIKMVSNVAGAYVKVKPWMELSNDKLFIIKPDKVLTMTETEDAYLISIYNNYITEEDDEDSTEDPLGSINGFSKLDTKMGYISSVEDARKLLEDLYKLEDTKES